MVKTKRGLPPMTFIPDKGIYKKLGTYKGQKYSITSKDPEDVMAKIESFKKQVDSGVVDDNTTLWQYIQRWYPLRVAGLRPKSKEAVSNAVNNHILPKLGNLPFRDVKPMHIDELMAGLATLSSSLNHKVLVTLLTKYLQARLKMMLSAKIHVQDVKLAAKKPSLRFLLRKNNKEHLQMLSVAPEQNYSFSCAYMQD
jgi:hypothetical protein